MFWKAFFIVLSAPQKWIPLSKYISDVRIWVIYFKTSVILVFIIISTLIDDFISIIFNFLWHSLFKFIIPSLLNLLLAAAASWHLSFSLVIEFVDLLDFIVTFLLCSYGVSGYFNSGILPVALLIFLTVLSLWDSLVSHFSLGKNKYYYDSKNARMNQNVLINFFHLKNHYKLFGLSCFVCH